MIMFRHQPLSLVFLLCVSVLIFGACASDPTPDPAGYIESHPEVRVSPPIALSCEKVVESGNPGADLPEGVSPALKRDAQSYADDFGVELGEALVRLQGQGTIGRLGSTIQASEPDTYAGHWIQHEPQYRMVVLFTRDGESTICPYIEAHPLYSIVEVRSAAANMADLELSQGEAMSVAAEVGIRAESSINVFQNLVELYVMDAEQLESALEQAGLTLPDHVRVVPVSAFSVPAS